LNTEEKNLIKVREYAELNNLSTSTVYSQIRRGKLKSKVINKITFIEIEAKQNIEFSLVEKSDEVTLNSKQNKFIEDIRDQEIRFLKKQIISLEQENKRLMQICDQKNSDIKNENFRFRKEFLEITEKIFNTIEPKNKELAHKKEQENKQKEFISLNEYLVNFGFTEENRIKLERKLQKFAKSDKNIIIKEKKIYFNQQNLKLKDLLNYSKQKID
jgi:predicted DNA-binding transcriptional regulator AlpA